MLMDLGMITLDMILLIPHSKPFLQSLIRDSLQIPIVILRTRWDHRKIKENRTEQD